MIAVMVLLIAVVGMLAWLVIRPDLPVPRIVGQRARFTFVSAQELTQERAEFIAKMIDGWRRGERVLMLGPEDRLVVTYGRSPRPLPADEADEEPTGR